MNRKVAALFLTILLLTAAFFGSGAALAEDQKTEEPKYQTIYYGTKDSDVVFKIQARLKELGYFEEGENCILGTLDAVTVYALQRFYADNNYVWDQDSGISPSVQEFLIEKSPAPRAISTETPSPTPDSRPTPFPQVRAGEKNDEVVSAVQIALYNKGYYEGIAGNYTLGFFDAATEEAVRRFCETMRISYNQADGISLPLFKSIVAENAPVYAEPSPTPFSIIQYSSEGEEVRAIQNRLKELDYFRDYGEPVWGKYEEITQKAVRRFCEVHKISVNQNGMDPIFYEKLMSEKALSNPVDRREIHPKDDGDDVQKIQSRLFNLGYYKKDMLRTGVFDEAMSAAIASFATINGIEYKDEILTVALQDAIFAETAKEWSEEVEATQKNIPEKLTGMVNFMGIEMPLFVLILIIVIILAGLVFLIIRVFSSGKGDGKNSSADASYSVGGSSSSGGGKQLNLDIRYQGSTNQASVSMDKPLRIGRTERTLPLNPGDSDISRQHCQMSFRGDTLILRDYSTNGTEVNHQIYHNCECVIHNGDTIKIGNHEITVRY